MSQAYYDGAHDALTEAMQEINAAWLINPVKYEDFTSDREYWRAVALEAVQALYDSYEKDAEYVTRHADK